ncbi:MAG: nitroreductase family protein [Bacteroidetes bacterium]|nr:nitroreductase family protein [Bacteroidota bacterium]
MDTFQTMFQRRSIRAFQAKPIESDKLDRILEATNAAPSAGNLQAYEIYVVRQPDRKLVLARAAWGQSFVAQAGVDLVFGANPARSSRRYGGRGRSLYCIQDATIACTFAMLAATALGLGSTWVGAFDDRSVAAAVDAGRDIIPVAILAIGYPAEEGYPTSRRSLNDLVHER